MEKNYSDAEALGLVLGTQSKAVATIIAAIIASLMKSGALSEKQVRDEILKGLRSETERLRTDDEVKSDDLHPDHLLANSVDTLLTLIERSVFPQEGAQS